MRKLGILITVFMSMFLLCSLPVQAANAVLYDERGVLSDEEYGRCLLLLQEAADKSGMNVGVLLGGDKRSDYTIRTLADTYYAECFGKRTDGLLYYMDLSGQTSPYDYISTSGMGQFYYTNGDSSNRIDAMFDDINVYLYPVGKEDVSSALYTFSNLVVKYQELGVPSGYYIYDTQDRCYYVVKNGEIVSRATKPPSLLGGVVMAFFCFIPSVVIALILFFVTKRRYRFKSSLNPTAYVNRKEVQYHHQYDNFVRTHTSRVKIESNSGGSGGGHSGGGGVSHGGSGGGGRHR